MPTGRQGSIRIFRALGVDVFLHWSWFLIAIYQIQSKGGRYSSVAFSVLEYLALFLIVLLHEFGHAMACRQVGGTANQIVLWPLGGVAYVDPPPRPGATLWSIAAGPLVNVVLFPVLLVLFFASRSLAPDVQNLLYATLWIDASLFVFNILPIYPLDGGQILRSLLWFVLGRARSLLVATIIGLVGVAGFILLALWKQSIWFGAVSAFMLLNCWSGLKHALALSRMEKLPRRHGFACPKCKTAPPVGDHWVCGKCGQPFDTFQNNATCPYCATQFAGTRCMDCGALSSMNDWVARDIVVPKF